MARQPVGLQEQIAGRVVLEACELAHQVVPMARQALQRDGALSQVEGSGQPRPEWLSTSAIAPGVLAVGLGPFARERGRIAVHRTGLKQVDRPGPGRVRGLASATAHRCQA